MAFRVAREIGQRHGKAVTFSLQTNATMVTPELAGLLAENQTVVGVSLDGDEEINESVRGHTGRVLRGFRYLTGAFARPPGIIVTVTRCNARSMRRVVEFLDGLGVKLFRANQMGAVASWNAPHAPSAADWLT